MSDDRDIRIRMDLTFPKEAVSYAEQIRDLLLPLYQNAINIHEGEDNSEVGFIEVERCGHRFGLPCDIIARWEIGRGRII